MSRETYIQHFILREKADKLPEINAAFDAAEARGADLGPVYEEICDTLNMIPLGKKPCHTLVMDRESCLQSPVATTDLVECVNVVIAELKEKGRANLHEIYMEKNVADIPLYQAFELLIAHGAAAGVSPYDLDDLGQVLHPNHTTMNIVAGENLEKIQSICIAQVKTGPQSVDDYLSPKWDRARKPYMVLLSAQNEPARAASDAFQALNSPAFDESRITAGFRGPSLSVGDTVEIHEVGTKNVSKALCMPDGWDIKGTPREKPTVEMLGEECSINVEIYRNNNRPALRLRTPDGAPMCTATVNVPEAPVPDNHVIIKNCDENEGVAQKLETAGVGEIIGEKDGLALMKITHPAILESIQTELARVVKDKAAKKQPAGPELN